MRPPGATATLSRLLVVVTVAAAAFASVGVPQAVAGAGCQRWVARNGSDGNPGTSAKPWRTLTRAADAVPDDRCTVWVRDGVYREAIDIDRRFDTLTTFKPVNAYSAVFENDGIVLKINGARRLLIEGFEFRHVGPGSKGQVIIVDRQGDTWARNITLRNNIIHDSYDNDLLKIHNGAHFITVEGNVFYNQGPSEQHMDVNSVTDITIQDNIFFNDFSRSGRPSDETKHFIVVKDSNEGSDGQIGANRITIQRNVFMNWEGGKEAFVALGNDGKPYFEARNVSVVNNLMLGNSGKLAATVLAVNGARDVTFANNTVTGTLPSSAYAMALRTKGSNPKNRDIQFFNNIWSDATRTMDDFADGDSGDTTGLILNTNLYWNGGAAIPSGSPVSPLSDDRGRVVANPRLTTDQRNVLVPYWNGSSFISGNTTIRQEFVRIVERYARIPSTSPAVGKAKKSAMPALDILGRPRAGTRDLGAFAVLTPGAVCRNVAATIIGTAGNDVIVGTTSQDVIKGLGGDDRIDGGGGNDIICGGTGDDVLIGKTGDDLLIGGGGDDELNGGWGDDTLWGAAGADTLRGGSGNDDLEGHGGSDELVGGRGQDIADGGAGADTVRGGKGRDQLTGGAGADRLFGGDDDDVVSGALGSDPTLAGGAGEDLIRGGPGNDVLYGGPDDDRLNGNAGTDSLFGGAGTDTCSNGASMSSCEVSLAAFAPVPAVETRASRPHRSGRM